MRGLYLAVLVVFCNGCVTGYHPASTINNNGFSEIRLSENRWEVQYAGNAGTTAKRHSDFVLLRGAELALSAGYSYFTLGEVDGLAIGSGFTTGPNQALTSPVTRWSRAGSVKPVPRTIVVGYRDNPPDGQFYAAERVRNEIQARYGLNP